MDWYSGDTVTMKLGGFVISRWHDDKGLRGRRVQSTHLYPKSWFCMFYAPMSDGMIGLVNSSIRTTFKAKLRDGDVADREFPDWMANIYEFQFPEVPF